MTQERVREKFEDYATTFHNSPMVGDCWSLDRQDDAYGAYVNIYVEQYWQVWQAGMEAGERLGRERLREELRKLAVERDKILEQLQWEYSENASARWGKGVRVYRWGEAEQVFQAGERLGRETERREIEQIIADVRNEENCRYCNTALKIRMQISEAEREPRA